VREAMMMLKEFDLRPALLKKLLRDGFFNNLSTYARELLGRNHEPTAAG
jgi:hypothetical protein